MPTRRNVAAALLAVGLLSIAAAHAQPVAPSLDLNVVRRELDAFRTDLKRAAETRDIARLRSLIADTFTYTRASGRTDDKEARIIALLAQEPAIETGLVLDDWLSVRGLDTAILTARSPLLNRDENKTYDVLWMQVFTKIGGRWRLTATQESRVEPQK
jgi:Domain of unknown function (DUF4440)